MFDIVKKIGQVFKTKLEPITHENAVADSNILCSVNIELHYDNEIGIRYFWPKFDEANYDHIKTVSQSFGTLLFLINEGHLKGDMVETLSHTVDKDNKFDSKFTETTLQQWLDLINVVRNDPIVPPSTVFGQYKQ